MRRLYKVFGILICSLCVLFLGTFISTDPTVFGDEKSVVENGISITYGEQKWTGAQYCEFPQLSVSSNEQIKTIILSYSKNDTSNGTKIQEVTTSNINADADNTEVSKLFRTTASTVEIESFLQKIKFYCNTAQDVTILLSKNEIPNDAHYYPQTGHFYKYVNQSRISWIKAYNDSIKSNLYNWKGYLATVTSSGENDFIYKYAGKSSGQANTGWLGGTRAKLNSINTSNVSYSGDTYNYWYWACGPELVFIPNNSSWSTNGPVTQKESENGKY